jgi:hypothetical protein
MTATKRRRALASAAVIGLLGGFVALVSPARATVTPPPPPPSGEVPTGATADLSDPSSLQIECTWALADMDNDWGSSPKMTYKRQVGTGYHAYWVYGDDTPEVGPGNPCAGKPPSQADGATHIDVYVNPDDLPTERWIELWAAIDTPNASQTVASFDVYHRGKNFTDLKVQVEATNYTAPPTLERCSGPVDMYEAAIRSQQIDRASLSDTADPADTLTELCTNGNKRLFYGAFPISKHQPNGRYKVVAKVEGPNGSTAQKYFYINVLPVPVIATDFSSVTWDETFSRDDHVKKYGDLDLTTSGKPTIANLGNSGMSVDLEFASMCLQQGSANHPQCATEDRKRIDEFDAAFSKNSHTNVIPIGDVDYGQSPLPAPADPAQWSSPYGFGEGLNATLCPNDRAKMDFSLYTNSVQTLADPLNPELPAQYKGKIKVVMQGNPLCVTDVEGLPYNGGFPWNTYVNGYVYETGYWI